MAHPCKRLFQHKGLLLLIGFLCSQAFNETYCVPDFLLGTEGRRNELIQVIAFVELKVFSGIRGRGRGGERRDAE